MERQKIEALLRDHVRGVHEELDRLFRGVEKALNDHLAGAEEAIVQAFVTCDRSPSEQERRVVRFERR